MSLGTSPIRIGSEDKARGRTVFGADLGEKGDLHLLCVRSGQAPARIEAIDTAVAARVPGVVRIFTAADIPGVNRLGIIPGTKDQEFLAETYIRHVGQAVALVAAQSEAAARAAAALVKPRLSSLAGVFDPRKALAEGAPLVHPDSRTDNLLTQRKIIKGDADSALAGSAVIHEAEYSTSFIEHAALETEGGRAWLEDGRLVIKACTQNPHYDRDDVARFLGIEKSLVRVIQAETGGGFGGKLDVSVQPYLGLAAWLLQRPVRMVYTREESFLGTGKRHPLLMKYITGADAQGRLTALKADLVADNGAFASYGLAVALRAAVHATGPYFVPHVAVNCRLVYTNNPWTGAMRGFGVPQVALAHEGQMDALADRLGLDRLEIRLINALRPGRSTATGQVLTGSVGLVQCLEKIKPRYDQWRDELKSRPGRTAGIGLGAMFYGVGNTGQPNPATAQVEWTPEGEIRLYTGAAEIGQGSDTVLRQLAAVRLGLDPERIRLVRGDTDLTTNAGATSASRQTYISGNAVVRAAAALEEMILSQAGEILEIGRGDLEMRAGEVRVKGSPGRGLPVERVAERLVERGLAPKAGGEFDPATASLDPETGQGVPYATYSFAAQAAWVEVDSCSGEVQVRRVVSAHDVGQAINKKAVQGQICGGVMMGLGMALMEEFVPGRHENFENYHLPTIMDLPEIEPIIVEEPEETGPYGAKGVGEPALIPTAPAIAAGVSQAVGHPLRHLPLSLERVKEALTGGKNAD
ncbi:MAG: xanthine dehydrogenase family protein molybdopterin-binding subunit [Thermodesulfobacteriota bacterium]